MQRLTATNNFYECRLKTCTAKHWMEKCTDTIPDDVLFMCDTCPFIKYINKLAEYENKNYI